MVSGNAAVFIEDFRNRNAGQNPFPSTVKAHFIHTARDLNDATSWYNPGPDYASGHGVLNIQAAVEQLRGGGWTEDCVDQGATNSIILPVAAGTTSVKVTLVWDDEPASPATTAPALINDLDLVVTDGSFARHYPWTLDPANPSADAVQTAEDHLNNVEVVLYDGAVPESDWMLDVVGTSVPLGPQCYSLVWSPVAPANGDDADGDGFGSDVDCDDASAVTFPGAAENDSTTDCMKDADNDGYGDSSPAVGGVVPGTDCNDDEDAISPGVMELCEDGIDNDCDGTIDEPEPDCDPGLAVNLARFEGRLEGKSIVLEWETLMETDTSGFILSRAERSTNGRGLKGPFVAVSELIPARGSDVQGARYRFVDSNVQPGRTYSYRLEDINLRGQRGQHGPVSVTFYPEGRREHGRMP